MDRVEEQKLRESLKKQMPPADAELWRDLWPAMLRRMERQERAGVPWFDWALLALVGAGLLLAPQVIPMLLYHL